MSKKEKLVANTTRTLLVTSNGMIYCRPRGAVKAGFVFLSHVVSNRVIHPAAIFETGDKVTKATLTKQAKVNSTVRALVVKANVTNGLVTLMGLPNQTMKDPFSTGKWVDFIAKAEKKQAKANAKVLKAVKAVKEKFVPISKAPKVAKVKKPKLLLVDASFIKFVDKVVQKSYQISEKMSSGLSDLLASNHLVGSKLSKARKMVKALDHLQTNANVTIDLLNDQCTVYNNFVSKDNNRAKNLQIFLSAQHAKGGDTSIMTREVPVLGNKS